MLKICGVRPHLNLNPWTEASGNANLSSAVADVTDDFFVSVVNQKNPSLQNVIVGWLLFISTTERMFSEHPDVSLDTTFAANSLDAHVHKKVIVNEPKFSAGNFCSTWAKFTDLLKSVKTQLKFLKIKSCQTLQQFQERVLVTVKESVCRWWQITLHGVPVEQWNHLFGA